jgi:hypothetical protein
MGDPREDTRDTYAVPEDDDVPAEGWAFAWDVTYRGAIPRTPGGRRPDPRNMPPTRKRQPWAAVGGECARVCAALGAQDIRQPLRDSLQAACSEMLRDPRATRTMRDLVREWLIGLE